MYELKLYGYQIAFAIGNWKNAVIFTQFQILKTQQEPLKD